MPGPQRDGPLVNGRQLTDGFVLRLAFGPKETQDRQQLKNGGLNHASSRTLLGRNPSCPNFAGVAEHIVVGVVARFIGV